MPIEREFKYVLRMDRGLESYIMERLEELQPTVIQIRQGYLTKGGRVRSKVITHVMGKVIDNPSPSYYFTFKHTLTKRPGDLEFEMSIPESDFNLAWTEEVDEKLTKVRYVIGSGVGTTWEVDFFKHSGYTYLVLAECEVHANGNAPEELPSVIGDNLLFAVPEGDKRFQNRRLCDEKKVTKLLKEIA